MERVAKFDVGGRARSLHFDLLVLDLDLPPLAAVAVLVGIGRIQPFDVEILLIGADDREAPGDVFVVSERDAGQGRFAGADDVQAGGHQVPGLTQ